MSVPTHYQTLKVTRAASYEEIRLAYYDEARRWHPDRFSGRSAGDRQLAEQAMRTLNEAWRVLGDQARRTGYDDELDLAVRGHQASTGGGVSVQDGVTRIDPRLLDPEFLRTQRQYQSDVIDNRRAMALRFGPWIGLVALVIGIFIFTAYQGPGPGQPGPTTVAGPDLGVDANACVRVIGGPQLIEIPCTGVYDGRVIGAYEVGGACPDPRETIREVELSNGITACLGQ